ncbi:hypothetical protein AJ80_06595 [Polytolypa hystricis UAMH7299]|uniref:Major facilitator superfamily (MFS) profile domain-containing protein n=1 Tax=Polytolypa hystricis (strain UAMH7299) TaxID=1447883 RepID=A0A2B7XVI8_POLH7|nr:hypothetical protein AJ80_06595 [Polytolypa hystricis UAMH7299]
MSSRNHAPRRRGSTQQYQTFATPPPRSRGRPLTSDTESSNGASHAHNNDREGNQSVSGSPLPVSQMTILAVIAMCEQTALNSISPYLPDMASSFPEVDHKQVGVYVGTIASAFALAQFVTNYFWGWLSDRIGRKPVILLGTILTAACFLAFGFCRTLWQAIIVQALMGAVNGNQGIVSTCLGEITNRSNQSRAFTYLPVIYGIGAMTGPIIGGLLVSEDIALNKHYPYLCPNLVSAAILVVDFILTSIFLEESLQDAATIPALGKKVKDLFSRLWQFTSSSYFRTRRSQTSYRRLSSNSARRLGNYDADSDEESDSDSISQSSTLPLFQPRDPDDVLIRDEVLNRDISLLLVTYLIFCLSNVSFNSLYPIFAQAKEPTGRELTPREIGLSLAFAGVVTIIFQILVFGKLRDKMGNKWSYRAGLLGFVIAFLLMPFVGYQEKTEKGKISKASLLLAIELCLVLLIKTVAAVGGLTSALLLVTNSAPDHSVLGALNGLAQTLGAAGRAVGPFLSGGLFTLATKVEPKGEAMAFGVFGGVAFVGFLLSFGIRSPGLEAEGWDDGNGNGNGNDDDGENGGDDINDDDDNDEDEAYKSDDEETIVER